MPIHDWTRVNAGTFHHFHQSWIVELSRALNAGCLPPGYYAMAEQIAGGWGPDVLALEGPVVREPVEEIYGVRAGGTAVALAERPPQARLHARAEVDVYARKASAVVIRHASDHRVVAVIEIVSPGNKSSRPGLRKFVEKAVEILEAGVHLLIVDLIPRGTFDPQGMHGEVWGAYAGESWEPPTGLPLTLAAYIGGGEVREAYVEPTAVGAALIDMPLFLEPKMYVPAPLEPTYHSAWEAVPAVWRQTLEGGRPAR